MARLNVFVSLPYLCECMCVCVWRTVNQFVCVFVPGFGGTIKYEKFNTCLLIIAKCRFAFFIAYFRAFGISRLGCDFTRQPCVMFAKLCTCCQPVNETHKHTSTHTQSNTNICTHARPHTHTHEHTHRVGNSRKFVYKYCVYGSLVEISN